MTRRTNKFEYLNVVQGYYGGFGWEDLTASVVRAEALADLRAYREAGDLVRVIRRRVPLEPCRGCRRTDLPLHPDYLCAECSPHGAAS